MEIIKYTNKLVTNYTDVAIVGTGSSAAIYMFLGMRQVVKADNAKDRLYALGRAVLGGCVLGMAVHALYQRSIQPVIIHPVPLTDNKCSFLNNMYGEDFTRDSYLAPLTCSKNGPLTENYLSTLELTQQCGRPKTFLELQVKEKNFEGISNREMEWLYGNSCSNEIGFNGPREVNVLAPSEARILYNEIAQANKELGLKALRELPHLNPLDVAKAASQTRTMARYFVREVTVEENRLAAEYIDTLRGGELSLEQLFKKYQFNATAIVEAAGRTNGAVNGLVKWAGAIPKSLLYPLTWVGVRTGLI